MNEDIGSNIKRIRTAKGLRQVDLAGILGTSQQNLAQYESNKRKPKREQLEKIAAALDVDVNDLIPNSPKKKLIFNAQPGLDALDKALRMQRKAPTYSELLDQQELNLIVNYKLLNTKSRCRGFESRVSHAYSAPHLRCFFVFGQHLVNKVTERYPLKTKDHLID